MRTCLRNRNNKKITANGWNSDEDHVSSSGTWDNENKKLSEKYSKENLKEHKNSKRKKNSDERETTRHNKRLRNHEHHNHKHQRKSRSKSRQKNKNY